MAITVAERWSARKISRGTNKCASVEYVIAGTDDDGAAADALDSFITSNSLESWDGIPLQTKELEQIADQIWIATVTYSFDRQQDQNLSEYSFDTGGGTQKITQTPSGLAVTAYGINPPNFQGAINVDDNSVNGVDIIVPTYNFSETRYVSSSTVTESYKLALFNLTGKVNHATWHGYAAGEVLFMGVSGGKHGKTGVYELCFKFAASPNKTGITIGGISGIAKKGWEYLWVRYEKNTSNDSLVQVPKAVYVHQVYESGDFADVLGF
ncbi:hypothetical protein ACQ9LF_12765 [Anaerohalosphaeraceae bacterium U12dextr]|jgi:hypothetical protein